MSERIKTFVQKTFDSHDDKLLFCHTTLRVTHSFGSEYYQCIYAVQSRDLTQDSLAIYKEWSEAHFLTYSSKVNEYEEDIYKGRGGDEGIQLGESVGDTEYEDGEWKFFDTTSYNFPSNIRNRDQSNEAGKDYVDKLKETFPYVLGKKLFGITLSNKIDLNFKKTHSIEPGYAISLFYVTENGVSYADVLQKLTNTYQEILLTELMELLSTQVEETQRKQEEAEAYAKAFSELQRDFDDFSNAIDKLQIYKSNVSSHLRTHIYSCWDWNLYEAKFIDVMFEKNVNENDTRLLALKNEINRHDLEEKFGVNISFHDEIDIPNKPDETLDFYFLAISKLLSGNTWGNIQKNVPSLFDNLLRVVEEFSARKDRKDYMALFLLFKISFYVPSNPKKSTICPLALLMPLIISLPLGSVTLKTFFEKKAIKINGSKTRYSIRSLLIKSVEALDDSREIEVFSEPSALLNSDLFNCTDEKKSAMSYVETISDLEEWGFEVPINKILSYLTTFWSDILSKNILKPHTWNVDIDPESRIIKYFFEKTEAFDLEKITKDNNGAISKAANNLLGKNKAQLINLCCEEKDFVFVLKMQD